MSKFITRHRARFKSFSGQVNLPWGTVVECHDNWLFHNNEPLCVATSQNSHDYFVNHNDDRGEERGKLVNSILGSLTVDIRTEDIKANQLIQEKWDKVWEDDVCKKYQRKEHLDHWLWNHDFYCAPIEDLQHIAKLIGAI